MNHSLEIVIYLYHRMTALDAIGPYEVLRCLRGARVRFVAKQAGLIRPETGLAMLHAEHSLADVDRADILVVPGGDPRAELQDEAVLAWIRNLHQRTKWTTSVCVGSLILGAAGLLRGLQATSHWNALEGLRYFGAEPVSERFVQQGKIVTAAGVSAGIDMALRLAALEQGEAVAQMIQLLLEYDPQPPFDMGAPSKASPPVLDRARQFLRAVYAPESN